MRRIIVIRGYRPEDDLNIKELMKDSIMTNFKTIFIDNLFKEFTFQMMILGAAIMFIFFGFPFTVCFSVIPIIIGSTFCICYLIFQSIIAEINQEVSNISRKYMSNAFSYFWVAEAFEPYLMIDEPKNYFYSVMSEKQFRESNIDVSSQKKKIVGTIGLLKSHKIETGAWIKRLCVHKCYRRKGIGLSLLSTAVQFAVDEGFSCVDTAFSEYAEGARELCFKRGFELKQMYNKQIIGSLVSTLSYHFTFQIKPENNYFIKSENIFID